ncbi:hypothetical protein O988_07869 [Pseudogymnoascus sp. VKM F-3808]|nr:hypothetical protein O988_07869 [Pseudogymnoascus sp. VKM F-3808]
MTLLLVFGAFITDTEGGPLFVLSISTAGLGLLAGEIWCLNIERFITVDRCLSGGIDQLICSPSYPTMAMLVFNIAPHSWKPRMASNLRRELRDPAITSTRLVSRNDLRGSSVSHQLQCLTRGSVASSADDPDNINPSIVTVWQNVDRPIWQNNE